MNKIAAFILSFIILFQSLSVDLQDFNKIPALLNHISCHLKSGDNLADFIEMHYGNFQVAFVVYFQQYPFKTIESIPEKNNFNYTEPLSSLVVNNFFQPPKIA